MAADEGNTMQSREQIVRLLSAAAAGLKDDLLLIAKSYADHNNISISNVLSGYKDGNGRNVLHFAANFGHTSTCHTIIDEYDGDIVNSTDDEGSTPLHLAVLGGQTATVLALVHERGADINLARKNNDTPILMAVRHGYKNIVQILLDHDADLTATNATGNVLHEAAAEGNVETLRSVLEVIKSKKSELGQLANQKNSVKMTPLMLAAASGHEDCIQAMIECTTLSFAADAHGPQGLTALHCAAERGLTHAVTKILSIPGGKESAAMLNDDKLLPIHLAAGRGHRTIVETLMPFSNIGDTINIDELIQQQTDRVTAEEQRSKENKENANNTNDADDSEMISQVDMSIPLPAEATAEALEKAAEAKKRGNIAFLSNDMQKALEAYTEAIQYDGRNYMYYSNRCAVYMKLDDLEHALQDAKMCRRCQPDWAKGCYRHGMVLMKMERYEDAANVFYTGFQLDNTSTELSNAFQEAIAKGREQYQQMQKQQKA